MGNTWFSVSWGDSRMEGTPSQRLDSINESDDEDSDSINESDDEDTDSVIEVPVASKTVVSLAKVSIRDEQSVIVNFNLKTASSFRCLSLWVPCPTTMPNSLEIK